jgi:LemA protein
MLPAMMSEARVLMVLAMAAGVALCGAFVRTFNQFVAARNACRNARSGIDVQLRKRHELVPNLVRVVAAYAEHERTTLELVARARSAAAEALGTVSSVVAEAALDRALVSLGARIEAYPALKASDHFMHLQKALTEIEEQISAARRAFNAHAMILNNLAEQFPSLLVARLTGFSAIEYFADHDTPAATLEQRPA